RIHSENAGSPEERHARLAAADPWRPGLHRADGGLAHLGVLVLFHRRHQALRSRPVTESRVPADPTRRAALGCAGALCVAALAGCTTYNSNSSPAPPASTGSGSGGGGGGGGGGGNGGGGN